MISKIAYSAEDLIPIINRIKAKEGSLQAISRRTKINIGTLSNLMRGNYQGLLEKTFNKIVKFYGAEFSELNDVRLIEISYTAQKKIKPKKRVGSGVNNPRHTSGTDPPSKKMSDTLTPMADDPFKSVLLNNLENLIGSLVEGLKSNGMSQSELEEFFSQCLSCPTSLISVESILTEKPISFERGQLSISDLATLKEAIRNLRLTLQVIIQLNDSLKNNEIRIKLKKEVYELISLIELVSQRVGSRAAILIKEQRNLIDGFRKGK